MFLVSLEEVLGRNGDGKLEKQSKQRVTMTKVVETGRWVSWKALWKYNQMRSSNERVK